MLNAFLDDVTLEQLEDDPYPTYAQLRREARALDGEKDGAKALRRFRVMLPHLMEDAIGVGQERDRHAPRVRNSGA